MRDYFIVIFNHYFHIFNPIYNAIQSTKFRNATNATTSAFDCVLHTQLLSTISIISLLLKVSSIIHWPRHSSTPSQNLVILFFRHFPVLTRFCFVPFNPIVICCGGCLIFGILCRFVVHTHYASLSLPFDSISYFRRQSASFRNVWLINDKSFIFPHHPHNRHTKLIYPFFNFFLSKLVFCYYSVTSLLFFHVLVRWAWLYVWWIMTKYLHSPSPSFLTRHSRVIRLS